MQTDTMGMTHRTTHDSQYQYQDLDPERWARAWDASCDLTNALNAVIHLEGINPDSDEARYRQRREELMRAGRIYRDAVEHSETAEEIDRRFMAGMADAGLCSRAMHPDYTDEEHEAYMEGTASR